LPPIIVRTKARSMVAGRCWCTSHSGNTQVGPPPGMGAIGDRAGFIKAPTRTSTPHSRDFKALVPAMNGPWRGRCWSTFTSNPYRAPIVFWAQQLARTVLKRLCRGYLASGAGKWVHVNKTCCGITATDRADALDEGFVNTKASTLEEPPHERGDQTIPAGRYGTRMNSGPLAPYCAQRTRALLWSQNLLLDGWRRQT